jgi:hypothetical protein
MPTSRLGIFARSEFTLRSVDAGTFVQNHSRHEQTSELQLLCGFAPHKPVWVAKLPEQAIGSIVRRFRLADTGNASFIVLSASVARLT